jgi:hypothetical protein
VAKVTARIYYDVWEVHFTVPIGKRDCISAYELERLHESVEVLKLPRQFPIEEGRSIYFDGYQWAIVTWECEAKRPNSRKAAAVPRLYVDFA